MLQGERAQENPLENVWCSFTSMMAALQVRAAQPCVPRTRGCSSARATRCRRHLHRFVRPEWRSACRTRCSRAPTRRTRSSSPRRTRRPTLAPRPRLRPRRTHVTKRRRSRGIGAWFCTARRRLLPQRCPCRAALHPRLCAAREANPGSAPASRVPSPAACERAQMPRTVSVDSQFFVDGDDRSSADGRSSAGASQRSAGQRSASQRSVAVADADEDADEDADADTEGGSRAGGGAAAPADSARGGADSARGAVDPAVRAVFAQHAHDHLSVSAPRSAPPRPAPPRRAAPRCRCVLASERASKRSRARGAARAEALRWSVRAARPPPLPYKVDTSRPPLRTNWTLLERARSSHFSTRAVTAEDLRRLATRDKNVVLPQVCVEPSPLPTVSPTAPPTVASTSA